MPSFSFKNGKIHYTESGKGRAVVLLHGFLEDLTMWNELSISLSKGYRVIRVDLPGHGHSDCIGYVHSMELMAEAVKALMKKLKLRKIVLAGHSMGGYVSLAFAEKWPEMVKGILIIHSTALADAEERINLRNRAIEVVRRSKKLYVQETIPNLFSNEFKENQPELVKAVISSALQTTEQGIIAAICGMRDRKSRLSVIQQKNFPVHFIIGKLDKGINYLSLIDQAKKSKNGSYTLMEEVAHMGHLEAPEALKHSMRGFIRKCFVIPPLSQIAEKV